MTVVIGGNHEASNYMWELCVFLFVSPSYPNSVDRCRYHGGWLAPNIYFLGHAGCARVNGINIAGASGIFKPNDFRIGIHFMFCMFSFFFFGSSVV